MNEDRQMAIVINDLDSLFHRIEALPPHERLTDAGSYVEAAKDAVKEARAAVHRAYLEREFGAAPGPSDPPAIPPMKVG